MGQIDGILLGAMQGFGKPGVNFWGGTGGAAPVDYSFNLPGYSSERLGRLRHHRQKALFPGREPGYPEDLPLLLPEIVMNPPVSWIGEGFCGNSVDQQFQPFTCPEPGPNGAPIKMIYRHGGSFISTMTETNRWVRMYQSQNLEFVVMQDCHWQSETNFGDVILPASTNFEHSDLSEWNNAGGYGVHDINNNNHRVIIYQMKCIDPLWESKPDYEIYTLLAERLGIKEEYTEGNSFEDWNKKMFEYSDLPKYISYEDFKKKGYFVVPSMPPDKKPIVSFPLVLRRTALRLLPSL